MIDAHFFDLDTLIGLDSSVWIISKIRPKEPIIKISKSEFNLITKGLYKKFKSQLNISGQNYWLPENLFNTLKVRCKQKNIDITDLAFSMQEFMNPEIVANLDFSILSHNFEHLKNTNDDIYIICSKSSKNSYQCIIEKLEKYLFEIGLKPKNYYYISETFYNKNSDEISHKKVRLLLQHLVGLKTEGDKFTNDEISKYSKISFYDDDLSTIKLTNNINSVLDVILSNTDDDIKTTIKSNLKNDDSYLVVNQCTGNLIQPFVSNIITLKVSNLIKTFESFKFRF